MVRTLPWLTGGSATTTTKRSKPSSIAGETKVKAPNKRVRERSPSTSSSRNSSPWRAPLKTSTRKTSTAPVTASTPRGRAREVATYDRDRTPSTSPPPPLPSFSPMRSNSRGGPGPDVAWIMVEDEFLSTAQAYTKHLHHAEYKRLLASAQERTEAGAEIIRPVDWRVPRSKELTIKLRARDMASKVESALDKGCSDDEQEEEIVIGDKHLADLILRTGDGGDNGKRRPKISLINGAQMAKSTTRAAAGYGKQEAVAVKKTYDLPGFQRRTATTGARAGSVAISTTTRIDPDDSDDLDNALRPSSVTRLVSKPLPEAPRLPSLAELRSSKEGRQNLVPKATPTKTVAQQPSRHTTDVQDHKTNNHDNTVNLGTSILSQSQSKYTTPAPRNSHLTRQPSTSTNPPTSKVAPKLSPSSTTPFVDDMMPKPRSAALLGLRRARLGREAGDSEGRGTSRVKKEEGAAERRRSVKLDEIPTFLF